MAQYPPEITQRFHGTPEQMAAALVGQPPATWQSIVIEDYDPAWANRFAAARSLLSEALSSQIIAIEHVGSTSGTGSSCASRGGTGTGCSSAPPRMSTCTCGRRVRPNR